MLLKISRCSVQQFFKSHYLTPLFLYSLCFVLFSLFYFDQFIFYYFMLLYLSKENIFKIVANPINIPQTNKKNNLIFSV